ncbi:MAG TPA: hypothetical protein VHO29_10300 [Marmoricola sp.]|nr:hypothetical protein [Marmoricola sp.]
MTYDEPPPLLSPAVLPAVRTDADLRRAWHTLVGAEVFADRRLWLLFLGPGGRPAGPLLTLGDLPDGPWGLPVEDLVSLCRDILDGPGGGTDADKSVAMLLTRPGRGPWHVGDRAWGRYLVTAAQHVGGGCVWPVHRAHDQGFGPVAGDETAACR